jgi:hypothetical protein
MPEKYRAWDFVRAASSHCGAVYQDAHTALFVLETTPDASLDQVRVQSGLLISTNAYLAAKSAIKAAGLLNGRATDVHC